MRTFFAKTFLSLSIFLFAGLLIGIPLSYVRAQAPNEVGYCAVRTMITPEGCGLTIRSNCGGSFYPSSVGGAEAACRAAITSQVTPPAAAPTPPPTASANKFVPLTNLPGLVDDTGKRTLADYLTVLFRLSIGIGALAGVIKITFAGIKYMGTDAFSSKEEAKKDITGVLFGLLIMLSTVVILQLIYPGILNLNVLQQLKPVEVLPPQESPRGVDRYPDATGFCARQLSLKICQPTIPTECVGGIFFPGRDKAAENNCMECSRRLNSRLPLGDACISQALPPGPSDPIPR